MRTRLPRGMLGALVAALVCVAASPAIGQAILGTCTTCSSETLDPNCGPCATQGTMCFDALPATEFINGAFQTSDGRMGTDPTLHFARLVGGMGASASDYMHAVNTGYDGHGSLFYGNGMPPGFCGSSSAPVPAYADPSDYVFPWNTVPEDTFAHLDCWNGEIDRYYVNEPPHTDGERVCDGEQAQFIPANGAIFDLGGEGNRVAIFPYTDHPPLPCESFEYSVWLSDDPTATEVADPSTPDPTKWNPAQIVRAFQQGWIPDVPVNGQPVAVWPAVPNLSNPTQVDGYVQVFALPCGITFRYASVVAGNLGTPSSSCTYWSFDSELDAALGLNEDDTPICVDSDGDGSPSATCGGNDCDDSDSTMNPSSFLNCASIVTAACQSMVPVCPITTSCYQGFCAPSCIEGACAAGFTCVTGDAGLTYCLPTPCVGVTCPAGQLCGPNGCQDPCQDAVCPAGLFCINGSCVDPCANYTCPVNQHCEASATGTASCVPNCSCVPCTAGGVCDMSSGTPTSGRCLAPGCDSLRCIPPSTPYCNSMVTMCVAPCDGVVCPLSQICDPTVGNCVRDLCFGVACQSSYTCQAGMCVPSASMDAGLGGFDGGAQGFDAGNQGATGRDASMDGTTGPLLDTNSTGSCGCSVPGRGHDRGYGMAGAMLALAGLRRRRRSVLTL